MKLTLGGTLQNLRAHPTRRSHVLQTIVPMNTILGDGKLRRCAVRVTCILAMQVACNSSSAANDPLPDCVAHVRLSVISGIPPLFDWQPHCAITTIIVYESGRAVWSAWGGQPPHEETRFRPPARYGTAPSGAIVFVQPEALQAGHTYTLVVGWSDPQQPLGTALVPDSLTFIQ